MDPSAPTICVIDDDVPFRRALQRLLGAAGFAVETFESAEQFLQPPQRANIDCLVLDVHLGGMSGFDLQERLAAGETSIPIVFITAHDDAPTRERARKAGAVGYFPKPFDDQSLIAAIHKALGRA